MKIRTILIALDLFASSQKICAIDMYVNLSFIYYNSQYVFKQFFEETTF